MSLHITFIYDMKVYLFSHIHAHFFCIILVEELGLLKYCYHWGCATSFSLKFAAMGFLQVLFMTFKTSVSINQYWTDE